MKNGIVCVGLLIMIFLITACQYRKKKTYTWTETGDSIRYLIIDAGSGKHITAKLTQLTEMHESKEDRCRIIYLSDSNAIQNNKSILLFNSVLPDLKDDMLSKGFIGTFTTRQDITYLIVYQKDIGKYLISSD